MYLRTESSRDRLCNELWLKITYSSKGDTQGTKDQAKANNAAWREVCEPKEKPGPVKTTKAGHQSDPVK